MFWRKPKDKVRKEPYLFPKATISDDELNVLLRVSKRWAEALPPCESSMDFITSSGEYANWSYDAKFAYLVSTIGFITTAEVTKMDLTKSLKKNTETTNMS